VFLVDPVRRARFEFSPEMSFAVEIWQYEAFSLMADRKGNIRQALLSRRRTRRRLPTSFSFATL
jgi:hypothetical protein